jgi:hypothetical protein
MQEENLLYDVCFTKLGTTPWKLRFFCLQGVYLRFSKRQISSKCSKMEDHWDDRFLEVGKQTLSTL